MARRGRIPDSERAARIERVLAEVGLDVDTIARVFGLSRRQSYRLAHAARATARRARLARSAAIANTVSGMLTEARHAR